MRQICSSFHTAPQTTQDLDFVERLRRLPLSELEARLLSLTPQEQVILDFIVGGHCNKEICKALGIEVTTAKAHTSRIFRKLNVKNRVQAAVFRLWSLLAADALTSQSRSAGRTDGSGEDCCALGQDGVRSASRSVKSRAEVVE